MMTVALQAASAPADLLQNVLPDRPSTALDLHADLPNRRSTDSRPGVSHRRSTDSHLLAPGADPSVTSLAWYLERSPNHSLPLESATADHAIAGVCSTGQDRTAGNQVGGACTRGWHRKNALKECIERMHWKNNCWAANAS